MIRISYEIICSAGSKMWYINFSFKWIILPNTIIKWPCPMNLLPSEVLYVFILGIIICQTLSNNLSPFIHKYGHGHMVILAFSEWAFCIKSIYKKLFRISGSLPDMNSVYFFMEPKSAIYRLPHLFWDLYSIFSHNRQ